MFDTCGIGDIEHSDEPRPATRGGLYDAPGWRPGQKIMNTHWPARPADIKHHSPGLPVTARIVWAEDAEQYVEAKATRWDSGHIYVEFRDPRLDTAGVWLKPHDVYSSAPTPRQRHRPPRLKRVEEAFGDQAAMAPEEGLQPPTS